MTRSLKIITVPYHLGEFGVGVGAGPLAYEKAHSHGDVLRVEVQSSEDIINDIIEINKTQIEILQPLLASTQHFPVVLSGNCNAVLGSLAAINDLNAGVIWFDAHPDLNTPETSLTGYLDGMPLATALQLGLKEVADQIGTPKLKPANLLLVGTRDVDPGEALEIEQNNIGIVYAATVHNAPDSLVSALRSVLAEVDRVYVHIDLDVFDAALVPGTPYRVPGGLTLDQVSGALRMINEQVEIAVVGISYFDPTLDENNQTLQLLLNLLNELWTVVKW